MMQTAEEVHQDLLGKLVQAHVLACLKCRLNRAIIPLPEIRDVSPDCKHCRVHVLFKQFFEGVNPFKVSKNWRCFWQMVGVQ